ncbi:YkvA family protein [Microbacterium aerolatum]|uniref:YkvA family protein n=1 Tax=Microbacterium aerolatum TaxID=153731 RepID=UPI00384FF370
MPEWVWTVIGVAAGLAVIWAALAVALLIQARRAGWDLNWRDVIRLAPDLLRLLKRLASDKHVPRRTRWWLGGLLVYLLLPVDLIPDFIPVIGYADDAIVTVVALRYAVKHAGFEAVRRNWPGSPEGLASVLALARISPADERNSGA